MILRPWLRIRKLEEDVRELNRLVGESLRLLRNARGERDEARRQVREMRGRLTTNVVLACERWKKLEKLRRGLEEITRHADRAKMAADRLREVTGP